jgi:hypothetical protein
MLSSALRSQKKFISARQPPAATLPAKLPETNTHPVMVKTTTRQALQAARKVSRLSSVILTVVIPSDLSAGYDVNIAKTGNYPEE